MPSLSEFISSPIVENIMSIPGISEYNIIRGLGMDKK